MTTDPNQSTRAAASISPEAIRPQRPALAGSLLLLNFPNPATTSSRSIKEQENMRYLHTMLRVRNLDAALKFYQDALGLKEVRRIDNEKGRFSLVFLCAAEDV